MSRTTPERKAQAVAQAQMVNSFLDDDFLLDAAVNTLTLYMGRYGDDARREARVKAKQLTREQLSTVVFAPYEDWRFEESDGDA